jgi:hypothetical protein
MDLGYVECCCGEVDLGSGGVEAAAAEPVDDLLQVPDRRFNGCPSSPVQGHPLLGSQRVGHRLARCASWRRPPGERVVLRAACLVPALAQGDKTLRAGGSQVVVTGVSGASSLSSRTVSSRPSPRCRSKRSRRS